MCGCFVCTCGSDQIPFGNPLCVSRVTFRRAVQEYHQRIYRAWSKRCRHVQVVRQTVGMGSILVERIEISDRSNRIADLFQPPPLLYRDQVIRIFARSIVCRRSKGGSLALCDRRWLSGSSQIRRQGGQNKDDKERSMFHVVHGNCERAGLAPADCLCRFHLPFSSVSAWTECYHTCQQSHPFVIARMACRDLSFLLGRRFQ